MRFFACFCFCTCMNPGHFQNVIMNLKREIHACIFHVVDAVQIMLAGGSWIKLQNTDQNGTFIRRNQFLQCFRNPDAQMGQRTGTDARQCTGDAVTVREVWLDII